MSTTLANLLADSPYLGYAYSYPHKTAYRAFEPPLSIADLWRDERRSGLFLYLHIPFCEFRCGFCNLFTVSQPPAEWVSHYLKQLQLEAGTVCESLGDFQFARIALGGGTPTYLSVPELEQLWRILRGTCQADTRVLPTSVEASPATLDAEKIAFLRDQGVTRLSLGVESFDDDAARRLGRPQRRAVVEQALELLTAQRFPILNLDLIYGGEGETVREWLKSLAAAVAVQPEEIYLYPLYVRPQTGLGKQARAWDDERLAAYRAGRDYLLEMGYEQVSMRMFQRPLAQTGTAQAPEYCCQADGMIGLGCGARSYTATQHYSTQFAVDQPGVRRIVQDYLNTSPQAFGFARHGITLDREEQQRRYVLLSLLQVEGISGKHYQARFGSLLEDDFPELQELLEMDLAVATESHVQLTAAGIERSDAIGPWLYSPAIRARMESAACPVI